MFSTIAVCVLSATLVSNPNPSNPSNASNPSTPSNRSNLAVSLYVSYIALQALDVHSTRAAISSGAGHEANPALSGIAGSPAALIAVKAATAGATIWATEKLRKKHPAAAIGLMVALNSVMAAVVAHNYSVR